MSEQEAATRSPPQEDVIHVTNTSDTSAEDEAFRLDSAMSARQKRKRTSPRDHAILESAYQKNSKPDKEERLNLVKQVELGEKEVQIWFQNRRQNDRRKSKPLQPHELIPHFRNGIPLEATKQLPSPQNSQETQAAVEGTDSAQSPGQQRSSPRSNDLRSILHDSDSLLTSSPAVPARQSPITNAALSTPPSSLRSTTQIEEANHTDSAAATADVAASAQITKKRSHEEMSGNDRSAKAKQDSPKDPKSLRRTSSFVRLAVNADGSVKVRVNNETTPSPPKKRPAPPPGVASRRSSGLMRAQSDVSSTFMFREAAAPPRGPIGRSRDARTWEFYCDRSARSSLAARAEEEATGSAVGALGLMRSASQRKTQALSPNPAKHNLRRSQSGLKTKPNLSRTQSSTARLQGSDSIHEDENPKKQPRNRRQNSGSDSDKENWLPGTRASMHGMRRTEPTAARNTALERAGGSTTQHGHPSPSLPRANDQENRPTAGAGKEKGDDLDCVQGLLSLSQGAWR